MTIWLITQNDKPLAAFSNEDAAQTELDYLAYHGDGYKLRTMAVEENHGRYAEL
jgi:hypothetical protein